MKWPKNASDFAIFLENEVFMCWEAFLFVITPTINLLISEE